MILLMMIIRRLERVVGACVNFFIYMLIIRLYAMKVGGRYSSSYVKLFLSSSELYIDLFLTLLESNRFFLTLEPLTKIGNNLSWEPVGPPVSTETEMQPARLTGNRPIANDYQNS